MTGKVGRFAARRSARVQVVAAFVAAFVALQLLGYAPDPLLFGALSVVTTCLVSAADAATGPTPESWVAGDLSRAAESWGSDHVTTALARDLSRLREKPAEAPQLAVRVHRRIGAVLEARVWRTQGVDLRSNAQWARQLLPEDLATVYLGPPDAALLRPERLAALVTRIEDW